MANNKLIEGLLKMLGYIPMIYNQQNKVMDGNFIIKYPEEKVLNNALLFILPITNSIEGSNTLTIRYTKADADGNISHTNKTYNILVEGIDGRKRNASIGDIVANRLCMFRFVTGDNNNIILINNPNYNNIKVASLVVTNSTELYSVPKIMGFVEDQGYTQIDTLATLSQVAKLEKRVSAMENKFVSGTISPEKFFDTNPDLEDGTIYIQVEEQ